MENYLVSVIIPIYNVENYLKKCLDSIIKQTYQNLEIILINDGSTDNSGKICNEYKKNDQRIKVYYQTNKGPADARNLGIKKSIGKFIIFVDSDDYISERMIENMIKHYNDKSLIGVKFKNKRKKKLDDKLLLTKEEFIKNILLDLCIGGGGVAGYLFSRDLIKNLRFVNNLFFLEDMLFLFQYLNKVDNIKFLENDYYNYQENNNSITRANNNLMKKIVDINIVFEKLHNFYEITYYDLLENKKTIILEKELRVINRNSNLDKIFNEIGYINFYGNSFRYKIFCCIFNKRKKYKLLTYYYLRNFVKKVYYKFRGYNERFD